MSDLVVRDVDNGDPVLGSIELGPTGLPRVLVLSAQELRAMLEVAERSPTHRALFIGFSLKIELRAADGGGMYETAKLQCHRIEPERPALVG